MTTTKKLRCRFDCFIKIQPGFVSWLPGQKRTWCYRGDLFTDREAQMLRNLLTVVKKRVRVAAVIELYDNSYANGSDDQKILKISAGIVEINRLHLYKEFLTNYHLPEFLKP